MTFYFKDTIESTQNRLISIIKEQGRIDEPFILAAREQTKGIGSRSNSWDMVECGLYMSIAVKRDSMPKDLPIQSSSVYFGYIALEALRNLYAKAKLDLWLKWPNDFYLGDSKVGGIMTSLVRDYIAFGIGLNILSNSSRKSLFSQANMPDHALKQVILAMLRLFGSNIVESNLKLQDDFTYREYKKDSVIFQDSEFSWKNIFSKYKSEFHRNHIFSTHVNINGEERYASLSKAALMDDAGIMIDNVVLYSLR